MGALLILPGGASAEDPSLGEITVRAEPEPEEVVLEDPTSFATVVDTSEKTSEVDTVADVLSETVGVRVQRFGGLGAFSTLSIRGSAANQVQVYLDGIPMSRARNEVVNLGTLPLDGVERIEVYRSGVPISFSRVGPGGVVNIVTKSPGAVPRTLLSAAYGSFDSRKVDVERSQRLGAWEYLVFGTYTGTEGDFTFRDDNGTPTNPFDDRDSTRTNNASNAVDVISKLGYRPSDQAELKLTNEVFYKDEGVPGIGSNQSRDASFEELRNLTHLRGDLHGVGVDALDVRTTGHVVYDRSRFDDRDGEIGIGNQDTDDQTIAVGLDSLFTYYWGAHLVPAMTLAAGYEEFAPDDRIDPANAGADQYRVRTTVAAQNEVYLWRDRVVVVPAVHWDWVRDDFTGGVPQNLPSVAQPRSRTDSFASPQLGGVLRLVPGLEVLANVSRVFRPPSFGELFGDQGVVTGNPDLSSEEATKWDLGFRFGRSSLGRLTDVRLEYAHFESDFDDLIVLVPRSQSVLSPENVGSARVIGDEISGSLRFWRHVLLAANYTHQDATDESVEPAFRGKRLPGRPEDEAYVRAELYNDWARFTYEVSLIGDNYRDRGERDRVSSRNIQSLGLSVSPPRTGLGVTFEVKNLTDDRTADFGGFPLPGRSFFGTVQYKF